MPSQMAEVLLTFPARPLSQSEKDLVMQWGRLSRVKRVFVSERRSDDPAICLRVVIAAGRDTTPTHTIMAPKDMPDWVRTTLNPPATIESYQSLRAALKSICNVWE